MGKLELGWVQQVAMPKIRIQIARLEDELKKKKYNKIEDLIDDLAKELEELDQQVTIRTYIKRGFHVVLAIINLIPILVILYMLFIWRQQ